MKEVNQHIEKASRQMARVTKAVDEASGHHARALAASNPRAHLEKLGSSLMDASAFSKAAVRALDDFANDPDSAMLATNDGLPKAAAATLQTHDRDVQVRGRIAKTLMSTPGKKLFGRERV